MKCSILTINLTVATSPMSSLHCC